MSRVVEVLVHNHTGDRLNARAAWRKGADCLTLPKEIAKVLIISFILPLILSACAFKGDFDRKRPTIIGRTAGKVLPRVTKLIGWRGGATVTDEEIAMREAGHRLSSPLIPVRNGASGPNGNSGYGSYGARPVTYHNSHPLSAIEVELKMDHQALTQFGNASRQVLITVNRRMHAGYENTWLKTVKETGDKFGLGKYTAHIFKTRSGRHYVPNAKLRTELLKLRNNPEVSALMAGAFTQQNSEIVASHLYQRR